MTVNVIGGGLAGCEAALWLAQQGVSVKLYEQKPQHYSPAHESVQLAELVCSNSLKAEKVSTAAGLLKAEMRLLGSSLLDVADGCRVAAGGALAVDREVFASEVTRRVENSENITLVRCECTQLPLEDEITIVATGPLTEGALAAAIAEKTGQQQLSFYDAAAPIITAQSVDESKTFLASRYDKGEADYINCPFDKEQYEYFYSELVNAELAPLHEFEKEKLYEACMPIEAMARRGPDTMRFGPLRPVGLRDPRTDRRPWACVQLRRENAEGTLLNIVGFQTNLKFGEQKRVFSYIPGLENAEFVRYGVMHRNTFLNSPKFLGEDMALKSVPSLFFAGQITGVEGYMESAASGLLAARAVLARGKGRAYTPPPQHSMCGALARWCTAANENYQPMGANMGLLPPLQTHVRDKRLRYEALAERALKELSNWIKTTGEN